jgi:hypothetical protein
MRARRCLIVRIRGAWTRRAVELEVIGEVGWDGVQGAHFRTERVIDFTFFLVSEEEGSLDR